MDEAIIKMLTDLVGSVGVPGAILLVLAYMGIKAQPQLIGFVTKVPVALEKIAGVMEDVKEDVKEVRREVGELRRSFPAHGS